MLELGLELGARDFRLWLLVAAARSKGSDSGVGRAYDRAVPHYPPPPLPLPSRTNWTRLVPSPVLSGHVSGYPFLHPSPRAPCTSASCADAGARAGCDVRGRARRLARARAQRDVSARAASDHPPATRPGAGSARARRLARVRRLTPCRDAAGRGRQLERKQRRCEWEQWGEYAALEPAMLRREGRVPTPPLPANPPAASQVAGGV
jgi:hypothetical protein